MKVISRIQKRLEIISTAVWRFWFPTTAFAMTTIFALITIEGEGKQEEIVASVVAGLLGICMQLFIERLQIKQLSQKAVIYFMGLMASFGYYFYLQANTLNNYPTEVRTAILFLILLAAAVWIPSIKQSFVAFSKSLFLFIKAHFTALLSALVLMLGIYAVIGTYSFLISGINNRIYEWIAAIVWCGFFPLYFLSLLPVFPIKEEKENENYQKAVHMPKFFEVLLSYIIIPVILAYTMILILYIVKNITGSFWEDELLEPLLNGYIIAGWSTLYLIETISNKMVQFFQKYFPILLLIVTLFQTTATIFTIQRFGITDGRYFISLLLLFSFISSVLYIFKSMKIRITPLLLLALTIISILPGIGAVPVGNFSQSQQLDNVLVENNMLENNQIHPSESISNQDKEKIVKSVQYLRKTEYLNNISYLPNSSLYANEFSEVFGFKPYRYDKNNDVEQPSRQFFVEMTNDSTQEFNVEKADIMVPLQISDGTFIPDNKDQLAMTYNKEKYHLVWDETVDANTVLHLSDEADQTLINFDLTFLRKLKKLTEDWNSETLPAKELIFETENKNVKLTLAITSLRVEENTPIEGEFYLFITFKS